MGARVETVDDRRWPKWTSRVERAWLLLGTRIVLLSDLTRLLQVTPREALDTCYCDIFDATTKTRVEATDSLWRLLVMMRADPRIAKLLDPDATPKKTSRNREK